VQIIFVNIGEDFIVEFPCFRIAMWRIFEGFFFLDFLENFFPARKCHLGPMLASISLKTGGWTKGSLVILLMMDSGLGADSNCLATDGEEPSPTSDSFILGDLGDFLVEGFFGGIIPTI
jgi:hypothetical protein